MVAMGINEPVEQSDWVSPMVVQEKKTKGEIRICLGLIMPAYMIQSLRRSMMKYWIMNHTHPLMGFHVTIRS